MKKVFVVFLLSCLSVVSRGAGLWEDKVKCVVELAGVKIVIDPSSSKSPLELVQLIPLVQEESSPGVSRAEGLFDFGDGIQILFELEFKKGGSGWSSGGDRLLVRSWFIQKGE